MSGILGIFREAFSLFFPGQIPQRSLFWNCIIIAFIISAASLWVIEHKKVNNLTKQLSISVPRLIGVPEFTAIAPGGLRGENAILTFVARIKNLGTPSIADDFVLSLRNDDNEFIGQVIPVAKDSTLTLTDTHGQSFILKGEDFLPLKAGSQPIPQGGSVFGFISVLVKGIGPNRPGMVVVLSFSDITGERYKIEHPFTGGDIKMVDPRTLQKR